LSYQPPASSTFLSEQTSHQQPASGTFLSKQISTSHQQNEQARELEWVGFTKGNVDTQIWQEPTQAR
jgi:hypothetical protein